MGKVDVKDFLSHYLKTKKGNVLNNKGEIIGIHEGAIFYTIGERHGFTITKKSPTDPRYFVISKDIKKNTITVSDKNNHSDEIYNIKKIVVKNLHFKRYNMPLLILTIFCFIISFKIDIFI